MKVCMVTYSFYERDARVMQYAKALVQRGDKVDMLALGHDQDKRFETIAGVNVYRQQNRERNEKSPVAYLAKILRFLFVSTVTLARRSLADPYDVVHVHNVPDFLVFAAFVPKLLGTRVILDIHDILPEFYVSKFGVSERSVPFRLLVVVERASIAFSDHVIVANHLWRERLLKRSAKPEKCSVFMNFPDPEIFVARPKGCANHKFRILYPGTLNRHQGVDIAVRAFAQIAGKMPSAEFHIYGRGPEMDSLVTLVKQMSLEDRIMFHGSVPLAEVAKVMSQADLAIVPKRASCRFGNEAVSTKIMEFMSLGVPVIVSRTKEACFYHDESRVKFFESENVDDLANAVLLLWRSPEIREKLVAGAARYIAANSWQDKKREYLSLLDRLHGLN